MKRCVTDSRNVSECISFTFWILLSYTQLMFQERVTVIALRIHYESLTVIGLEMNRDWWFTRELNRRKWKRKSFVTVGKIWLVLEFLASGLPSARP